MRGIDFADLEFRDMPVARASIVGREGQGLETAFKAQQIVRLMSVSGNLGCADTGLRATIEFLLGRQVRGERLTPQPSVRARLASAGAALLVLDISARVAARALHTLPNHFANWSNVIKWLGPTLSENALADAAWLLGARSVLGAGHWSGIFEKARRDNLLIRFVDTSPYGVLRGIGAHLQALAASGLARLSADTRHALLLRQCAGAERLPSFDPGCLDLFAKGADPVVSAALQELPEIAEQLSDGSLRGRITEASARTRNLVERTETMQKADPARFGRSAELLAISEEYCLLHAAIVCTLHWWYRRGSESALPDDVTTDCLAYLLDYGPRFAFRDSGAVTDFILERHTAHLLYSAQAVPVAIGNEVAK
jgi:hypothetical protein